MTLGIIFILTGIWVLMTPVTSYIALSLLFSTLFFVNGILEIVFAIANRHKLDGWGYHVPGWGWLLALSLFAMFFSFMLIFNPVFAGLTIVVFTAMALFLVGTFRILLAIKLKTIHNIVST